MYEYIKGTLIEATPSKAIVETGGVGFSILIPFSHFSKLPQIGAPLTLFVSFVVREDAQRLFGFLTRRERDLFENLIEVSGIGPKTALCLIGHMEISDLQIAITQGNIPLICKIPGIGKKTAERLVVEMRDKLKKEGVSSSPLPSLEHLGTSQSVISDAISALMNLGYNNTQAQKAIKTALGKLDEEPQLAALITTALRCI